MRLTLLLFLSVFVYGFTMAQDFTMAQKGIPRGGTVVDMEISPSTGALFAAVTSGGLYKSTDNGVTWTKISQTADQSIKDIDIDANGIVYAVTANILYTSTDNTGTTFTTNPNLSSAFGGLQALMVRKSGNSPTSPIYVLTIFQSNKQSLFRSVNGGTAWTEVYSETLISNQIKGILVNNLGNVFLTVNGKGVIKSATGANSYAASNTGLTSLIAMNASGALNQMVYAGSDLYAMLQNAVFKSVDNGVNWTDVTPPGYTLFGGNITALGNVVYMANTNNVSVPTMHVYSSGTWTSTAITTNSLLVNKLVVRAANELYLGSDVGVLKSPDITTWTMSNSGIEALAYSNFMYTPLFVFGDNFYTMSDPVQKSTDNGATWTVHGTVNSSTKAIVVMADGTFLSPNGNTVRVSTDAGATWTNKAAPSFTSNLVADGANVYLMSGSLFYKSTDNGTTWNPWAVTGLPAGINVSTPNNMFVSNGYLYYAGFSSTLRYFRINTSTLVATEVLPPPAVATNTFATYSLWEYNGKLIFYSFNSVTPQLYTSADLGANWTQVLTTPTVASALFTLTSNGYWVLTSGSNGAIKVSRDEGVTWISSTLGLSFPLVHSAIIDQSGYLNILVDYKGLYKSTKPIALPSPPTDLKTSAYTFNNIRLEWKDNAINETYYRIERSTGDNLHYDSIGSVTPTTQATKVATFVNSVDPGMTYYYRVVPVNNAGSSNFSNEISVTTPAKCASSIPNNRNWQVTTQNLSGLGARTATTGLLLGRLDDFVFSGGLFAGNSPAWVAPYNNFSTGASGSIIENCGSVYLNLGTNLTVAPDGNGTWDANTKTITIKWKLNEALVAPGTAAPVSETSVLTMLNTYPAPVNVPTPFVAAYDDTGIGVGWTSVISFGTETAIERATAPGGPFTEVGRVTPPDVFFVDRTAGATNGTTYYYRLKGYNPDSPGGVAGGASASVAFTKPYFAGVETQSGYPTSTRLAAAWSDVNNDGYDDIFFTGAAGALGGESPTVLINQKDGTFVKKVVINRQGLQFSHSRMADFDNDGNVDLIAYNPDPQNTTIEIYSGDGAGNFTKMWNGPKKTHINTLLEDFDKDGKLDFLMATSSIEAGTGFTLYTLSVMRNMGNFQFTKSIDLITAERISIGSMSCIDYDNDGDRDIALHGAFDIATTVTPYRMMDNNGDGTYTRKDLPSLNSLPSDFVSVAEWVDIDNDQDLDLMLQHGSTARELFRNEGQGNFTNLGGSAVIEVSNSTAFTWLDVDNDGDQDLVYNTVSVGVSSAIYLNNGSGVFTKKVGEGVTNWHYARNVYVYSDYNHDGSVDLFVGSNDIKGRIFKGNNFVPANNWISIKLKGVKSNRSGVNSAIKVTAGGIVQKKMVSTTVGSSFGGHNSLVKHFGIGPATTVNIEVTWPSGKKQTINNVTSNQFYEVVEDTDGPALSALAPAHNSTGIKSTTQLAFTLDETFTASAGKFVSVFKASDTSTPLYKVAATSASVAGNTLTYTLPGKLPSATNIVVSVDAGAFTDIYGNGSLALATDSWKFTTASGPAMATLSPANSATNVALNAPLVITFNKNVIAVAGKKVTVKKGATTVLSADVATGTVSGTTFTLTHVAEFPFTSLLTVSVDAGAFQDNATDQNDFAGILDTQWSFTTAAQVDNANPVITEFKSSDYSILAKNFSPLNATVKATDNVGVESVTLFTRKTAVKAFTSKPGTKATDWTIQFLPEMADDMGFEYYIEAKDAAGNIGRFPTDGSYFNTRIKITDAAQSTISIPAGGTKQSWRIISMPYELQDGDTQIGNIFAAFGSASPQTWRMLHYDNKSGERWAEYPEFTNLERGKGYFVNTKTAGVATLKNPTAPTYTQGSLFSMDLVKGWNQIGNPYTVAINWNSIRTYNNNPDIGVLVQFNNGSYSSSNNMLQAGQGGFVLMNNAAKVFFAFPDQTSTGRIYTEDVYGTLDSKNWMVDLKLMSGDIESDLGGFGMNDNANFSYDKYDGFNAPRFFDYVEMSFDHPEHFYKKFARDIIPSRDEHVWDFEVQTNLTGVTSLTWDHNRFGENQKQLILYDIDTQTPIDMRSTTSYSFDPAFSRKFRVYYGENAFEKIMPARVMLGAAYPNPMTKTTTIPFTIPDQKSNINVRIEILDMTGRNVGTVVNDELAPGFYNREWNPNDGLSDGLYVYRLTAGDVILTGKVVMKK